MSRRNPLRNQRLFLSHFLLCHCRWQKRRFELENKQVLFPNNLRFLGIRRKNLVGDIRDPHFRYKDCLLRRGLVVHCPDRRPPHDSYLVSQVYQHRRFLLLQNQHHHRLAFCNLWLFVRLWGLRH